VTGTAPRPGGGTTVTLQTAQLYDAFSAYDAHFDGAVAGTLSAANKARARAMADVSGPGPMALSFLSGKFWNCGEGVNVNDLMAIDVSYAGTAYLDFSLAQRSLDFSMRGAVSVTFTLLGGLSVSCSVTGELPFELPLGATGLALKFGGTGELSAEMPETSAGGTFSITGGIRAFAGYGYFDGASTGTQTVHPFGSARSNADGLSLSLKLGVFVKVGVAVPPGEDDVVDASGSLTLGAKFEAGRPDPASDPQHREMRGGQCVDVTLAPYVKIGAEVAVPFFPDVSFDIAEYDGPELDLFKGKCWGYSGTVKTTVNYVISAADQSCTLQYCGKGSHIVRSMTKTLIPQAASFTHFVDAQLGGPYGSPIAEPYSWVYNQADQAAWEANPDPFGLDPPPSLPCSSTTVGAAGGTVGWNPDVSAWAWVVDGYEPHSSPWATSGVPEGTVDLAVSVTGEENPCGSSYVDHTSPQPFDAYGAEVANLLGASSIFLTLTGSVDGHPGWHWTTTVNLARADYTR